MRSVKEIQAHIRDLRICADPRKVPCRCSGIAHDLDCQCGSRMMLATANALEWALGEKNGEYEHIVEDCAQVAVEANA